MNDPLHLFALQLREQLSGLREVAVQGRWEGPAPASLPRAVIATRLLAGSSELLGMTSLQTWLQALLELLNWIAANPDGSLAAWEQVLRETVALEEQLIECLDAGGEPGELVTPERVAALQQGFLAASRALNDARSRGQAVAPREAPVPTEVRLGGLDDLRATVSWERFFDVAERLITKVPHLRTGPDHEAALAAGQARWRDLRALGDALFRTEGDWVLAEPGAETARDPGEALPELPGGDLFREALEAGWREGLAAVGRAESAGAAGPYPWSLRWRVPGMTPEGPPPGAPGIDEQFPGDEQRRYGRLLGLMLSDLCLATGPDAPRWLLLVDLSLDRVTAEYRRPPGRVAPETARALGHLLEEDFLIEAPNLRGALRRLKRDGALVHAHFGSRGEGSLQVVLPLRLSENPEVCVVPLADAEVAAPLHLVEAVLTADGWQRRAGADGDVLVKEGTRVMAADLALWVDGLLPAAGPEAAGHLVLVGLVEKRVALLASAPARRARVARRVPCPAGWDAVASGGIETADGACLPLLDVDRVIALRLRRLETADGVGGDPGADWADPRPASPAPLLRAAPRAAGGRIVLLVASPFRAGDLGEKLRAAGFEVLACRDADEARARLAEAPVTATVCDNAEPSRCLETLLGRLEASGERPAGRVILAAGGAGDQARRLAKRLGADGAWTPPYLIDELRPQLA